MGLNDKPVNDGRRSGDNDQVAGAARPAKAGQFCFPVSGIQSCFRRQLREALDQFPSFHGSYPTGAFTPSEVRLVGHKEGNHATLSVVLIELPEFGKERTQPTVVLVHSLPG